MATVTASNHHAIDDTDYEAQYAQLKEMLGSVGEKVWIAKTFSYDNGKKIFIGNNFTGNFNLTILDIREVYIGDNVMIGPGTLITTVGPPSHLWAEENTSVSQSLSISVTMYGSAVMLLSCRE